MLKKKEIIEFFMDRKAVALLISVVLGVLLLIVLTVFNLKVSDIQVPFRYSDYGFTNLYRDRWYALSSFGILGLLMLFTNGYLALKLHASRRGISLGLLAITLLFVVIALIVSNAVFRLATFSI